jgi:hypothetical protein
LGNSTCRVAFECGEEVVKKDTLAWLDPSSLASACLLFLVSVGAAIGSGTLLRRLATTRGDWLGTCDVASAHATAVDLSAHFGLDLLLFVSGALGRSRPSRLLRLLDLLLQHQRVVLRDTHLLLDQLVQLRLHGWVLLDESLLLLDELLELFLVQLVDELLIEDGHLLVWLLHHEFFLAVVLAVQVRDGIELVWWLAHLVHDRLLAAGSLL